MLDAGWQAGQAANYHRDLGLDTAVLFEFLGATQAEQWDRLVEFEGGDPDAAQRKFAEHVGREINARGAVDVLRHGGGHDRPDGVSGRVDPADAEVGIAAPGGGLVVAAGAAGRAIRGG